MIRRRRRRGHVVRVVAFQLFDLAQELDFQRLKTRVAQTGEKLAGCGGPSLAQAHAGEMAVGKIRFFRRFESENILPGEQRVVPIRNRQEIKGFRVGAGVFGIGGRMLRGEEKFGQRLVERAFGGGCIRRCRALAGGR